jgi:FkbM family methyltransferase
LNPRASFIQIGGNVDAHLQEIIFRSQWRGVVVEPVPPKADELQRTYASLARVSVEQAAIASADGNERFYYDPVPPRGALRREVLYFAPNFHPDLDECVVETVTATLTLESLCGRYGLQTVDVLRIDTAGDEAEVLTQVDRSGIRPAVIVYDHGLLGNGVRRAWTERLRALGYGLREEGGDTWCLSTQGLPTRQAATLKSVWRLTGIAAGRRALAGVHRNGSESTVAFPVTDDERRYLTNHYDDRVPLPSGAADYLSDGNPRLRELRQRYASLDLPAVQHHLWSAGRIADNVDLRYFRGDNLYVWHRPEHPRAMALKLVLFMRYLQDRGGGELLDVLDEDGGFGCWTTEVTGYGKISRDLLDSVNEILFLDHHLGVLTKELRVLDVGAGYGRLAHRMATAAPALVDYCCVDAVAESTFLAEYYLNFRGCSPPARVLPLPDVIELEPESFDLAVNVHSFSECTLEAIRWWADVLQRLRVPYLFVVPNEPDGIMSREPDGSYHSALPVLEAAGYVPVTKERAIADRTARDALDLNDNFYLFALQR